MNPEYTPGQYRGGAFRTFSRANKSTEIAQFQEKKMRDITAYTDAKTLQINVTSAFNGAAELCTALLAKGEIEFGTYWKRHEEIYQEYFSRLMEAQRNVRQVSPSYPVARAKSEDATDDGDGQIGLDIH